MDTRTAELLVGLFYLAFIYLATLIGVGSYKTRKRQSYYEVEGPGVGFASALPVFVFLIASVSALYILLRFASGMMEGFDFSRAVKAGYECARAVIESGAVTCSVAGKASTYSAQTALVFAKLAVYVFLLLVVIEDLALMLLVLYKYVDVAVDTYAVRRQYFFQLYGTAPTIRPVVEALADAIAYALYVYLVLTAFRLLYPGGTFPLYSMTFEEVFKDGVSIEALREFLGF